MGERAYYLGWLLCFKLSWSSYHNLGESNPTNILFVPKYKSQSRLVLCSKHSQRDARVRISEDLKSTPFSPLFIYDCFHTTKINWVENTFIHISNGEWRLHNLWIWGPHKSALSQYLVCTNCQREALFHLTMVNSSALSFHNFMWRKLNFILWGPSRISQWLYLGPGYRGGE